MNDKQRAWIACPATALRESGSWTGRIHLHKHLFVVHVLGLAEIPFDFELHHYGPYSFRLDDAIATMEAFGELDKVYPKPGYGPTYRLTELGSDALGELSAEELRVARLAAIQLSSLDSGDLELLATCLWVELCEGETRLELILPRVQEIKPKYPLQRIRWAYSQAADLRQTLAQRN